MTKVEPTSLIVFWICHTAGNFTEATSAVLKILKRFCPKRSSIYSNAFSSFSFSNIFPNVVSVFDYRISSVIQLSPEITVYLNEMSSSISEKNELIPFKEKGIHSLLILPQLDLSKIVKKLVKIDDLKVHLYKSVSIRHQFRL
jgi:hypothetical protein